MADNDTIILIILCIYLPPLAIYWKSKKCDIWVLIDLVLCCLFCFPGMLLAFWFCFFKDGQGSSSGSASK